MQRMISINLLILLILTTLFGCAMGKKEWPKAQESEDSFRLELIKGERRDNCLFLEIAVHGTVHRLWRASIQYEAVGSDNGEGCSGCPFVPRDAVHFTRDQKGFVLDGHNMKLSICDLEQGKEYRFRVAGKSELPTRPLEYTDVYVALP